MDLARPLLLISGDRVWTGMAGSGVRVTRIQPAASGFSYQLILINCVTPAAVSPDALPNLGWALNASLFDRSALGKPRPTASVTVSYHGRPPFPAWGHPGRSRHGAHDASLDAAEVAGVRLLKTLRHGCGRFPPLPTPKPWCRSGGWHDFPAEPIEWARRALFWSRPGFSVSCLRCWHGRAGPG
jgi:hypothetical protein